MGLIDFIDDVKDVINDIKETVDDVRDEIKGIMEETVDSDEYEEDTEEKKNKKTEIKPKRKMKTTKTNDPSSALYDPKIEQLINCALIDGTLTEKEKQVLFKKAEAQGIDLDEFEMILDARLFELGKAEKAKAAASDPKSNKMGEVIKCPSCGAIVQSYQVVCNECGYIFEKVEANYAVKELSNLLMKAKSEKQMSTIIDTFPIPLEKAAIIALATWLAPQCLDVQNPLSNSYQKKYDEVINKAKATFGKDKDILPLIAQYDTNKNILTKNQRDSSIKNLATHPILWIIIVISLITGIIVYVARYDDRTSNKMVVAINNGNLAEATKIYQNYRRDKVDLHNEIALVLGAYIKKGDLKMAEKINRIARSDMGEELASAFWQYIEKGDMINAEKIFKMTGIKGLYTHRYEEKDERNNRIAKHMYDHYINYGEYDKARLMVKNGDENLMGTHILDVVVDLCEKGQKKKARQYLNTYSCLIDDKYDKLGIDGSLFFGDSGGDRKHVIKLINDVITKY